jgi:hypothetical protein
VLLLLLLLVSLLPLARVKTAESFLLGVAVLGRLGRLFSVDSAMEVVHALQVPVVNVQKKTFFLRY